METAQYGVPLMVRNARPVISHGHPDPALIAISPNPNATARRTELDRIVDQVTDRLDMRLGSPDIWVSEGASVSKESNTPRSLRHRCMKLDHIGRDEPQVDACETGSTGSVLHLRDTQKRAERAQDRLRIGDRRIYGARIFLGGRRSPPRTLESS